MRTVREPLLVLDSELYIRGANSAFYDTFAVTPEETIDHPIYEIGNRQWDVPKLRSLLEDIIPEQATFEGFEMEHELPGLGRRVMLLNARTLTRSGNADEEDQLILLAIEARAGLGPRALPTGSGTILVVEDDDPVRSLTRRVLERSGTR